MNINNKTVLITGGGSGIGLAIAQQLSERNNKVIITGRTAERLQAAAATLKNVTAITADVTNEEDVKRLVATIQADFGGLDILINNAGFAHYYSISADSNTYKKGLEEFNTNFFSILNLTEQFLPALQKSDEAAVVNVSSILGLVPHSTIPTYSASKAALHSYTQSLRFSLKDTAVKVFELMPPLVNTDFSKEIGGENGIAPSQVADDLISAFESDSYEIHVGDTAHIYALSDADRFNAINAA